MSLPWDDIDGVHLLHRGKKWKGRQEGKEGEEEGL